MTGLAVDYNVPMKMTDDMGEKERGRKYYIRAYHYSHLEQRKKVSRAGYLKNKIKVLERTKERYKKDPDKAYTYQLKWKKKHQDKVKEYSRIFYERHKEHEKKRYSLWAKNNKDFLRASNHNYRARKVRAEGSQNKEHHIMLMLAQQGNCFYCGASMDNKGEVDHMIPLSRGGSNWPWNTCYACSSCNSSKKDKTDKEFITIKLFPVNDIRGRVYELHKKWYNESAKTAQGEHNG